jgi:hypothetical protein
MLIPLKRETSEQIIPLIATGNQYAYYWGNWQNFLKNLFISLVGVLVIWLTGLILRAGGQGLSLILRFMVGLYWLWGPVYWASLRNASYRRYPYSAFWRGRILDVYITEELINERPTFNKLGDLMIIENREKRINLEVGDESGFSANIQAPLKRIHKAINPGQAVQGLLLSNDPNFTKIAKITDVYVPRHKLWIGEYPYLRRDVFLDVSRELARMYARS